MNTSPNAKYTPEQALELANLYSSGKSTEELAEYFDTSKKSIIAKLVQMGVYQSKDPKPRRLKKSELVQKLCDFCNLGSLTDLDKAPWDKLGDCSL